MANLPHPSNVASNTRIVGEALEDARASNGADPLLLRGENDTAFENGTALGSGGNISNSLGVPGAESLSGVVTRATTSYDLDIEWLDGAGGNVIQTESIASGTAGGTQTTFDVPARSPYCNVVVSDAGAGSGAVDLTAHLR